MQVVNVTPRYAKMRGSNNEVRHMPGTLMTLLLISGHLLK